jgi:putative tryptophan/tyrosine transport system substrate-binding protein
MRRRDFNALLAGGMGALGLRLLPARAQSATKRHRVAVLSGSSASAASRYLPGLVEGMRKLGYVEGQNLEIEYRYADGDLARLPVLARELVALKPEVIVATNTAGALALGKASSAIPIVGVTLTDPVGFGMAANYNRPGGMVTGILSLLENLPGKQLEIARDIVPNATRTGVLINVSNESNAVQWRDIDRTAPALHVQLVRAEVGKADIAAAFRLLARERAEVLVVLQDSLFLREQRQIAMLAAAAALPTVYGYREHVDAGGLISYGVDLRASCRQAAVYVDKILTGTAAGELPLEFPSKLEMVINLKAAKALGLEIASTLLVRADELIE